MKTQAFASVSLTVFLFAAVAFLIPHEASAQDTTAQDTAQSATTQSAAMEAATVQVTEQEPYGAYLTDAGGMSLYLFRADSTGAAASGSSESTCYDACAEAWPPLLTEGEPEAGEQVDASLLGTTERTDGSVQVTYGGHPLYYYAEDQEPGDASGQDVMGFGAEWYLVSPQGETVEAEGEH